MKCLSWIWDTHLVQYSSIILSFLSKNIDWLRRRGNKKIESIFFVHQQSCGGIVTTNLVFYSRNVNEWAFTTEIEENVRESREEAIIGKWRNHFVLHKKEREVDHRKKIFFQFLWGQRWILCHNVAYNWCLPQCTAEQNTPIQKWLHLVVVKA